MTAATTVLATLFAAELATGVPVAVEFHALSANAANATVKDSTGAVGRTLVPGASVTWAIDTLTGIAVTAGAGDTVEVTLILKQKA